MTSPFDAAFRDVNEAFKGFDAETAKTKQIRNTLKPPPQLALPNLGAEPQFQENVVQKGISEKVSDRVKFKAVADARVAELAAKQGSFGSLRGGWNAVKNVAGGADAKTTLSNAKSIGGALMKRLPIATALYDGATVVDEASKGNYGKAIRNAGLAASNAFGPLGRMAAEGVDSGLSKALGTDGKAAVDTDVFDPVKKAWVKQGSPITTPAQTTAQQPSQSFQDGQAFHAQGGAAAGQPQASAPVNPLVAARDNVGTARKGLYEAMNGDSQMVQALQQTPTEAGFGAYAAMASVAPQRQALAMAKGDYKDLRTDLKDIALPMQELGVKSQVAGIGAAKDAYAREDQALKDNFTTVDPKDPTKTIFDAAGYSRSKAELRARAGGAGGDLGTATGPGDMRDVQIQESLKRSLRDQHSGFFGAFRDGNSDGPLEKEDLIAGEYLGKNKYKIKGKTSTFDTTNLTRAEREYFDKELNGANLRNASRG